MIAENSRKKRAFGYVRVSTSEQAEHETSLRQRRLDLQNYCDKQGIELTEIFVERGFPALSKNDGRSWRRCTE